MLEFIPIRGPRFNPKAIFFGLEGAIEQVGNGMESDFDKTHKTFSNESKPKTTLTVKTPPSGLLSAEVQLEGLIYFFVHQGTKPHIIRPRKASMLRFPSGYTAKTSVGQIASRSGGPSGNMRFVKVVNHPGFPGRKQNLLITNKWKGPLVVATRKGLNRGIKRSGHSA